MTRLPRPFDTDLAWGARVKLTSRPVRPDALQYDPSPEYLRGLLLLAGLSQRKAADALGLGERVMRYYLAGESADHRSAPYPVQYALEQLARAALDDSAM